MVAPRVISAALKGDDALLRSLVDMFEREGFRVVGAAEAAPDLIVKPGVMGRVRPTAENEADIAQALQDRPCARRARRRPGGRCLRRLGIGG